MKYFIFFICGCLSLAKAQAQNTLQNTPNSEPFYYYASSLDKYLRYSDRAQPIAVKLVVRQNVTRATVYDPATQLPLAVIRGIATPCYGKKGAQSVLMDSSFTLKIPQGNTISFDANERVLTFLDEKGRKIATLAYILKQGDTSAVLTRFYTNGKPLSIKKDKRLTTYNPILDASKADIKHLAYEFGLLYNDYDTQQFTYFYPNGQLYKTNAQNNTAKTAAKSKTKPYFYTVYDSLGATVAENVNFKKVRKVPKIIDYSYNEYGRLDETTDYRKTLPQYLVTTMYDDTTGSIISKKFEYKDSLPNKIAYISEKPDGFFRKNTLYKTMEDGFSVDKWTTKYPLFHLDKAVSGKIKAIYLIAQSSNWKDDACPLQPQYIMEGKEKQGLPDGEWRIFMPDNAGSKAYLAVGAGFKMGLPDGNWFALDAQRDTLASAVYKNGVLLYNKFAEAYHKQENMADYIVDSTYTAQLAINARNKPIQVAQHRLHLANNTHIWQRDTILIPLLNRDNGKTISYPIICVLEQLSADSKGMVRLRYFYKNQPQIPVSVARFDRTTQRLDSAAVFYDYNKNILQEYDFTTNLVTDYSYNYAETLENIIKTRIPNDSTRIVTYYDSKDTKRITTITTDSFYYTPSLRKGLADKPVFDFSIETMLLDPNKKQPVYNLNSYSGNRELVRINESLSNATPVSTKSTSYYDNKNKFVYSTSGENTMQYDPKDTTKMIVFTTDKSTWNGLKADISDDIISYTQYKNGKREGENRVYNENGTVSVYAYKKDVLNNEKTYDENGVLIAETNYTSKTEQQTEQHFDYKYGSSYIKKYKNIVEKQANNNNNNNGVVLRYLANGMVETRVLETAKHYNTDSTGKKQLRAAVDYQKDGVYLVKTWYASGSPQIVYAGFETEEEIYRSDVLPLFLTTTSNQILNNTIDFLSTSKLLIQHPNGRLWAQGCNNVLCLYDTIGRIKAEHIQILQDYTNTLHLEYPNATATENCHWDNLPYQEGKMENGRRVGTWRGYFRKAKKTLQYVLNYNAEGVLDGMVEYYDTSGQIMASYPYKNGLLNGKATIYAKKQPIRTILYENNEEKTVTFLDNKGLPYEIKEHHNDTSITIKYAQGTQQIKTKTVTFKDEFAVYDAKSRLLSESKRINDGVFLKKEIDTTQTPARYKSIYTIENLSICATQAEYLEKISTEPVYPSRSEYDYNTAFKTQPDTIIQRIKRFTTISGSPALTIDKLKKQRTTAEKLEELEDMEENGLLYGRYKEKAMKSDAPNIFEVSTYTISDAFGTSLVLQPNNSESLLITATADSVATTAAFNPIKISGAYRASCGNSPSLTNEQACFNALNENAQINLNISSSDGLRTFTQYPARLLHPADSLQDAIFAFRLYKMDIVKNFPHQYLSASREDSDENEMYYSRGSNSSYQSPKQQMQSIYNTPISSFEKIGAIDNYSTTQTYTIGKTSLNFTPKTAAIINNTPLQSDGDMGITRYATPFAPIFYPQHQSLDKNSNLVNDDFLNKAAIRTFCKYGFINFAPLITDFIPVKNVLIDKNEINGSFDFSITKTDANALAAQCKAQGISLIITEKNKKQPLKTSALQKSVRYTAHFRYAL
jgi:antitoxin component YwqK of YwqJK toxin-antitoxin module